MDAHAAVITLCTAAVAGIGLIALADRLRLPSIALLLVGGILLGPEVLGMVEPNSLGGGLETVVTLAVAVVLFEGGLTLDIAGFRREPQVIVRLLTVGVAVTWMSAAAVVYIVYRPGIELALIAGSLVIVTGPTVVSPLLRRIGLQPRLHHILYWEGVLVDAVGVFVAVLCYEWMVASADQTLLTPIGRFGLRFAFGAGIGLGVGLALGEVLRRRWISEDHTNIVVLGGALLALAMANSLVHESGILAVIVTGLVLSLRNAPQLKELKRFKLELTEVGIGLLFVLLAARLDLSVFIDDGGRLLVVLAVVLLVSRPINVGLSTWRQGFSWREKAFLSWLAPRGIVAASMASLFSLRLQQLGHAQAPLLETLTYAVIGTTVVVQGLSARRIAGLLKLRRRSRATWLLIGDPAIAQTLHRQLWQADARSLVLTSAPRVADSRDTVEFVTGDPLVPSSIRDPRVADVEAVLALAPDPATNDRICRAWSDVVGRAACYRWDGRDVTSAAEFGRSVWAEAPGPARVRDAIEERTYALEALETGSSHDAQRFGSQLRPLLAVDEGNISVVDAGMPAHVQWVVALRRRTPGFYGLVRDAVIIDRHQVTFADAIEAVLDLAVETSPSLPVAQLRDGIMGRELTMPTAIGGGVAVPHVYDDHADRARCFVASIPGGLDTVGPDDDPVRFVFLVVSPSGKPVEHLNSLAAVAHIASDTELMSVLSRQRTRGRLLSLLRERE